MLYSIGKDSAVMLHLAMKAFHPGKPPFPLLHVDTTWKFREMYAFRDRMAAELGHGAARAHQPGGRRARHQPVRPRLPGPHRRDEDRRASSRRSTSTASTRPSAAPGATRRSRAPRSACSRSARRSTAGTPRTSGPSCGTSTTRASAAASRSASSRSPTGPSSTSGSTSSGRRSRSCRSTSRPSGPVVTRDGTLLMVDDDRMPLADGEQPGDAPRALPHARRLPAHGRRRELRHDRRRDRRGDARRRGPPSARAA